MSTTGSSLNAYILKICKEKNISIKEFADRMYISKESAYNTYLSPNGRIRPNPTVRTLLNIANAIEVDPVIIFKYSMQDCRNAR